MKPFSILFYSILFYSITHHQLALYNYLLKISNNALHSDKNKTNKHCHSEILCSIWLCYMRYCKHFHILNFTLLCEICCCRGNDSRTLHTLSSAFCHLSFLYCPCQHIITDTFLKEYTAVIQQNTSTSTCFIL